MLSTERSFSRLSLAAYSKDIRNFIETLPSPELNQVTQEACLRYLDQAYGQKLSDATIARRLSVMNQFFSFLVNAKALTDHPLARIDRPRILRPLPDPLTHDEVLSLIKAARALDLSPQKGMPINRTLMLELFYATGMRVSELVQIRAGDYLPGKGLMVRGKGRKDRFIPLTSQAHDQLQDQLSRRNLSTVGWVFTGKDITKPMTRQRCALILKDLAQEGGVDPERVYPHALRHAFATHLLEGGADLMSVQRLLGHADIATTEIYTHVTSQTVRKSLDASHPLVKK